MPEIRDFLLIIIAWGEADKIILQVSMSVFRARSKIFSGRWLRPPPQKKIGPYTYAPFSQFYYVSELLTAVLKVLTVIVCTGH